MLVAGLKARNGHEVEDQGVLTLPTVLYLIKPLRIVSTKQRSTRMIKSDAFQHKGE